MCKKCTLLVRLIKNSQSVMVSRLYNGAMDKSLQSSFYQASNGAIELSVDTRQETIWATQAQISKLYGVDRTGVTKHINKVLKDGEVDAESNVQKMHITGSAKPTNLYSLDIILAVGYRANSADAIKFRKWATSTLRSYITDGYLINPSSIQKHYDAFLTAVETTKRLLAPESQVSPNQAMDLVTLFADTWLSLEAYDSSSLPQEGFTKAEVDLSTDELAEELARFKNELTNKGQATQLFGQERHPGGLNGILGAVFQSFDGEELYKTVEEKAAHLLYFMVKNHIYVDGNKRNAAYAFTWLLKKAGLLNLAKTSPQALTTLTILIAESDPKEKDRMVQFVMMLLAPQGA